MKYRLLLIFFLLLTALWLPQKAAASDIKQFIKELDASTDIPTICVYTKNNAEVVSREDYVECTVYTLNCDSKYVLNGKKAGIRVRGNSTAFEGNVDLIRKNQVPYRIKFEKKQMMFGLNSDAKCKSWVLLKGDYDLLKNDLAFRFGRSFLRNGNYCSDGIPVHLYLNGKFIGIYELCEQSQVNKNRINIKEPSEGYTGTDIGYLVELDNHGEQPRFTVNYAGNASVTDANGVTRSLESAFYSIKSDVYSDKQVDFIGKYINNCFKIVYQACENGKYYVFDKNYDLVKAKKKQRTGTDSDGNKLTAAEVVIGKAMDLDSFVDLFLVYELTMSRDVGEGSFYMCVDFSENSTINKLTFTCPWDFEWSMMGDTTGSYAKVFNSASFAKTFGDRSNPWYVVLIKQDWFLNKVKERWTGLRTAASGSKTSVIDNVLSEEEDLIKKYKTDLSKKSDLDEPGINHYSSAQSLINWVEKRLVRMDSEYLK